MNQFQTALDGQSLITPDLIAANAPAFDQQRLQDQLSEGQAELALLLSLSQQQFENGLPAGAVMQALTVRLDELRKKVQPAVWHRLVPLAQSHSITRHLFQDPLTRWSFDKPRGYSGDAQLLDFIYEHPNAQPAIEGASQLGRDIYGYTSQASSSVAVRERRDLLTGYVDAIAEKAPGEAEVLAIAAGHLREANRSQALASGSLKRWVALDQDPLSVESIGRDFAGTGVEAVGGSVRTLLARPQALGKFDFIYAAGLYDYLAPNVAIKLTERCLQMLKPGGSFLFANFAEGIRVEAYMETFMNWSLLWRSEEDMWSIIRNLPDQDRFEATVEYGENRNVIYGILRT
jgi:SAM-dependent methyltransferase